MMEQSKLLHVVDQSLHAPGNLKILPVIPYSLEFTVLVKKHIFDNPPSRVLVGVPYFLEKEINRAIPHIPSFPVITVKETGKENPDEDNGEEDFSDTGLDLEKKQNRNYWILEAVDPFVEVMRSCYETGIPFHPVDGFVFASRSTGLYRKDYRLLPDTYILHYLTAGEIFELYRKNRNRVEKDPFEFYRDIYMAIKIQEFRKQYPEEDILVVISFRHLTNVLTFLNYPEEKGKELLRRIEKTFPFLQEKVSSFKTEIHSLSEESKEVLFQPGYYQNLWNKFRNEPASWRYFDRVQLNRNVYKLTKNEYEAKSGEFIPPQKEKLFFQFARNLSLQAGRLLPLPLHLLLSAKAFINDNFAVIFYHKLMDFEKSTSPFRKLDISLRELEDDVAILRFREKLFRSHQEIAREMRVTEKNKEKYKRQWRQLLGSKGMCSYPPEDILVEEFGSHLRKKALSMVQSSEVRVLPFTSSLFDGIDYRETIRNYYREEIYVKEFIKRDWDSGNVVVIFSTDEKKYPWKNVWWGEHEDEGDMAYYATDPGEDVVGPGIARCFYGGFMLSYPPRRLPVIWEEEILGRFEKAHEKLLAAAILYNMKNAVVYVAEKPHSRIMQDFASRFGQKIIYIPIATINQQKLHRIRRFHVLSDKEKRKDADKYIW